MGRRGLGVIVLACAAIAVVSCTVPSDRRDRIPPGSTAATAACVDATRKYNAKDGVISAGPFDVNQGHWGQPNGTKLWVATSVDQPPTAATIVVAQLDGGKSVETAKQTRGTDQIAEPAGAGSGLFYPGTIRLASPGTWRLTVTIGGDTGCFQVTTT